MPKFAVRFFKNQVGATAIEYALIASLIAVVVVASLGALGARLSGSYNLVTSQLP
ncbi:Flp family type IVb pilin [Phenylobacterium sp.]|jgi:pilus assembly protein Flp/PilA|uniref:Flp family type IVb pilin n=1 Tax=Phenylobacterium sp. TaxID=1871053 RepID=UPI002E2ECFD6|nr:Flp family type IVb pilin [Phenylobacterium sp.]HEX4711046.1 Flp family type IVb pilin [Phenylobacterium sp.]